MVLDKENMLARVGGSVMLGCTAESFPNPVTSWATESNMAITQGVFLSSLTPAHQVTWFINSMERGNFGTKLCKSTVGGRFGIIKEERKGFVDTSLIIKNIALQDDNTR